MHFTVGHAQPEQAQEMHGLPVDLPPGEKPAVRAFLKVGYETQALKPVSRGAEPS